MFVATHLSIELPVALKVAGSVVTPTGLVLAWLLLSPRRDVFPLILSSLLGVMLASPPSGPQFAAAWLKMPLVIGAYHAGLYFAIRRLFPKGLRVCEPRALVGYHLLIAPAALAFSLVFTRVVLLNDAPADAASILNWTLAELNSLAVLTPGILALAQAKTEAYRRRYNVLGILALLLALGVAASVLTQERYPLLFLVPTILLLASVELEVVGAAVGVVAIAIMATAAALTGHGPTVLIDEPRLQQVVVLQVFMLAVSMASFGMAATAAQKRRTSERLEEEAHRAAMAESVGGIAYWEMKVPSRALSWSPGMYALVGLEPGTPVNFEDSLAYVHPDDAGRFVALIEALLRGEEWGAPGAGRPPSRLMRPDGSMRYVSGRAVTKRDADGQVTAIFGTVVDVTELHLTAKAVAESEARYRAIAENSSDLIVRVAPNGELIYASPSVLRIMGVTPEQARQNAAGDIHPEDETRFHEAIGKLCSGELAPGTPIRHRRRHLDGHYVWLEAAPAPIFGDDGKLVEVVDVIRDVTQQMALEEELKRAKSEAEAAAEVKSQFLANMSHELRTPLTAVLGFSWLIEQQPELSETTRAQVKRLNIAGAALHTIINDVLDFTKLEAGRVAVKPRPTALHQLLHDSVDTFGFAAESKGLTIRLDAPAGLPEVVEIDPERVRQILMNLVGNAVKFTDVGEVVVSARYDRQQRLEIVVSDTGPGVTKAQRARLFQRFSQVDGSATRRHGGSGLGLAICKGIVEAMGGQIGVKERPGGGSRFWFKVPAPAADAASQAAEPTVVATPAAGLRVLVVDDHPVNRHLARAVLEPFGVEVAEAPGGREAIELAGLHEFDVILMDVRMPEVDGVTAMRAIRAGQGASARTAILAFSAEGEDWVAGRLEAGFDGHVAKPMTVEGLTDAVARAGARRNGQARAA